MKLLNAVVGASIVALSVGSAFANTAKKGPHCEKAGKATKAKVEAACTKDGGKWVGHEESQTVKATETAKTPADATKAAPAAPAEGNTAPVK